MMMSLLRVALMWFLCSMASAITVCSDTNSNNTCETASIDEALKSITSFTTLYFEPGTSYILQDFTLVRDLTNISLVGGGHTTIMCHQGVGLAFFNVSNLHIENVVVTGCGIHGNATGIVQSAIQEVIDMFFRIPTETNIAMVLGSCTNVHLQHVTIAKTSGLGLLGVNVMGSSVLNDVNFTNNTWTVCKASRIRTVLPDVLLQQGGGGAIFLYHNHYVNSSYDGAGPSLLINRNNFIGNRDCSPTSVVERLYRYSTDLREIGYIVGGGGGLTLMIAQSTYYAEVLVELSVFRNNSARYGSGAHIGIFNDATNCDIQFSNCTFTHNGLTTDVFSTQQFSVGGAGLAIWNDLFSPQYPFPLRPTVLNKNITVTIKHSDFTNNSAYQGSGLYIFSHYTVSTVRNKSDVTSVICNHCMFNSNIGAIGPAFFAYEAKLILTPGMYVEMSDFVITNNIVAPLENANFRSVGDSSAAVHFQSLVIVFKGKSEISYNHGTGVYGNNCDFVLSNYTSLTIAENVGDFGGGMRLITYSFLYLLSNSTLVFRNNVGIVRGGALYVSMQDDATDAFFDCFVYAGTIDTVCRSVTSCNEFQDTGIKIAFSGNVAPLGSIVYGSTLSTCLWVYALKYQNSYAGNDNAFEIIQRFIPNVIDIGDGPIGINEVTTLPNRLILTNSSHSAIPGQVFNISVAALDRLNQRAPAVITSTVQSDKGVGNTTSQLGRSGYFFAKKNTTTDIPIRVFGPANQTVVVGLYSVESYADTQITVNLEQCAPGFVYDDSSSSCACLSDLSREGIECDTATQELEIPRHVWVGPIDEKHDTNIQLVHECIFDYCRPGRNTIAPPDYDTQCAEGYRRTGMLCGSCPHGYSVVFGTNRCLKCTNTYLLLLVAFIVAGIVLVLGISLLHITITNGYLNAILFYCNMISLYTTVFVPRSTAGAFIVVAFLNLNLGIETCFYDGMDALARAGLQLLFPAYLFFLMAAIVLLARIKYFKCFAHAEFSAVKMFGTLLILCYTSILQSCTEILGIIRIDTFSGETLVRWVVDPSVTYFQGWHGLLGSIALVLVVFYVSLFPILLLFPSYIYQIRYIKRLKPLYDALYNPFNAKARCWLGIRLILRSIPLALAVFAQFPMNVFLLAIYLIALLYVQLLLKPFKEQVLNAVDNFLVANMIFLILGALYFDDSTSNTGGDTLSMQTTFSYVFVYIAYTVFAVILLYYIYLRLPKKYQNAIKKFLKKLLCCFHWEREESEIEDLTTSLPLSPPLPQSFNHVTHSSVRIPMRKELRAHLLEGNLETAKLVT